MCRVIHCGFVFPTGRFIFVSEPSGHRTVSGLTLQPQSFFTPEGFFKAYVAPKFSLGSQVMFSAGRSVGCCRHARRSHLMLIIANVIVLTKTFNYHVTCLWQCITGGHSKSVDRLEVCEAEPVYALTRLSLPLRGRLRRLGTNKNGFALHSLTISLPAWSSQPRIHNLNPIYPESTAEAPPSS